MPQYLPPELLFRGSYGLGPWVTDTEAVVVGKRDELLDTCQTSLVGVDEAHLNKVIVQVARDFCHRTMIWQDILVGELQPAAPLYQLIPSWENAEIAQLQDMAWGTDVPRAYIEPFQFTPPDRFMVRNMLSEDSDPQPVVMQVALAPTLDSELPEFFFGRWFDALHYGVMARMTMLPGKPYTNATLASANMRLFGGQCSRARAAVTLRNHANGGLGWAFPYFGGRLRNLIDASRLPVAPFIAGQSPVDGTIAAPLDTPAV